MPIPSCSFVCIFFILVNRLQASSFPNYQCAASEGKVISESLKASYVLDSIKSANNSTDFLGTVRISAIEYFEFYSTVSPNYGMKASYDLYRRRYSADVLQKSVVMPSIHLCLQACSENPACESLIYQRDKTECHILSNNVFISREFQVHKNLKISDFDREVDLVEPKEMYFVSKKCLSRSPVEECEDPRWSFNRNFYDSIMVHPMNLFPTVKKWTDEILNNICMEKGAQLCVDNKISSFSCNLVIGNDENCTLPRESAVFTSKCNGSTIETLVQKLLPEIGDDIKFENGKLTLPACSESVRQDCIYILPSAESPTWYWVLPLVIMILIILVGVPILVLWIWNLTKERNPNFRAVGNDLSESRIRRLAQVYLSSENRAHQLPTTQIREDTNDRRLSAVIQVDFLSSEHFNFIGKDDPPSYDEIFCSKVGVMHAEEQPPPGYRSPVPNESNQRNTFVYTMP